jgi:hypothetical protein
MPRRNRRKVRPQMNRAARRGTASRTDTFRQSQGRDITPLVRADGWCEVKAGKKKAAFDTEEKAAKALDAAQHNRALLHKDHIEKRYYLCPRRAEGGAAEVHYHLTSLDAWEERGDRGKESL